MTLSTVQDYLTEARTLLQDLAVPYRYPDADLVRALNVGLLEARRVRPDMYIMSDGVVPSYSESNPTAVVDVDQMYRSSLVYYVIGRAQLRDAEEDTDARAAALLNKFTSQLLVFAS
jgi:hypothetical protein